MILKGASKNTRLDGRMDISSRLAAERRKRPPASGKKSMATTDPGVVIARSPLLLASFVGKLLAAINLASRADPATLSRTPGLRTHRCREETIQGDRTV